MQIEVIYIPPPPKKEKSTVVEQKTFTKRICVIKISESVDMNFNNTKFTAKIIIIDVQWQETINKYKRYNLFYVAVSYLHE